MGFKETVFNLIDGNAFSSAYTRKLFKRKLQEELEQVPVAEFRQAIEAQMPSQMLVKALFPRANIEEIQAEAPKYAWIADRFSDEEAISLLPKWLLVVLDEYGEEGRQWLRMELRRTRQLFFTKETHGEGSGVQRGRDDQGRPIADKPQVRRFIYRPKPGGAEGQAGPAPGGTEKAG